MVSYAAVQATNCVILLLSIFALFSLLYVTFKYLIKREQKLYITLFYCFSVPLMITDIMATMYQLVEMKNTTEVAEKEIDPDRTHVGFYEAVFFIGDVFYIGLVLSMISGIATISTGLEIILDQVRMIASTDRSAHFSKDQSSLQGNKRKLLGMRILVGIIFVGFVTLTTLIFTEVFSIIKVQDAVQTRLNLGFLPL